MRVIKTKTELDQAIKDKIPSFVVEGDLAEKVKKSQKIMKLSKVALVVLSTSIATIMLAPATGGVSGTVGTAGVFYLAATEATTGVSLSTSLIAAVIAIGGVSIALALFKDYDVEYSFHPTKGLKAKFIKK